MPARAKLHREDFVGALSVLVIVFASTFPIVIPFMIFEETVKALRVSNAVALFLLFAGGYRLGKFAGYRPWLMGISLTGIGIILVLVTIALGG
jgi:VIT1/CCC1 family predicted Fe2+/Mn2+ transporter